MELPIEGQASTETLVYTFPIAKRQYERCQELERQEKTGKVDGEFRKETIAWLMKDLRLHRRMVGLPSIGSIVPAEEIQIATYGKRSVETQGAARLFD